MDPVDGTDLGGWPWLTATVVAVAYLLWKACSKKK